MQVLVLGAGVIGVTSAYYLAKNGYDVTVIDANDGPSRGCSLANGGQLSFGHIESWSDSLSLTALAKNILLPNSDISLYNFKKLDFLLWSISFLFNNSQLISKRNAQKLSLISSLSRELFNNITKEEEIDFCFKKCGILHFYRTQKQFEKAIKSVKLLNLSQEVDILDANECLVKEPSLLKMVQKNNLAGGIFYKNDYSGDCALFTNALAQICQKKYNVKFDYNNSVKNIFTNYQKITGVNTEKGVYKSDFYVYALGVGGINLLKGIKINPKIYPIKGYSLSSQVAEDDMSPKIALTDVKNRIVYSSIGKVFRIAGVADINNLQENINKNKINFLKKNAQAIFSSVGDIENAVEWYGFRPFRNNSLPLICQVPKYGNLFLNTGHGSLGWTLSLASGMILENSISNKLHEKFDFLKNESIKLGK